MKYEVTYNGKVTNAGGYVLDFDAARNLMDEDICAEMAMDCDFDNNQDWFAEYERRHEAKYGETWELSKSNPTW